MGDAPGDTEAGHGKCQHEGRGPILKARGGPMLVGQGREQRAHTQGNCREKHGEPPRIPPEQEHDARNGQQKGLEGQVVRQSSHGIQTGRRFVQTGVGPAQHAGQVLAERRAHGQGVQQRDKLDREKEQQSHQRGTRGTPRHRAEEQQGKNNDAEEKTERGMIAGRQARHDRSGIESPRTLGPFARLGRLDDQGDGRQGEKDRQRSRSGGRRGIRNDRRRRENQRCHDPTDHGFEARHEASGNSAANGGQRPTGQRPEDGRHHVQPPRRVPHGAIGRGRGKPLREERCELDGLGVQEGPLPWAESNARTEPAHKPNECENQRQRPAQPLGALAYRFSNVAKIRLAVLSHVVA